MSEEKLQVLELEQRLVQAEMARVMRDHKISLFVSREADLEAEVNDKEWRISELEVSVTRLSCVNSQAELESANTSIAHQRAAESKAQALAESSTLESKLVELETKLAAAEAENLELEAQGAKHRAEREDTAVEKDNRIAELEEQVVKLVEKRRTLKEKFAEANAEIEQLSNSKGDASSEVVAELRTQLRAAKFEASKQEAEAADTLAELEISKEREKALKSKFQEAHKEQLRLAGIEVGKSLRQITDPRRRNSQHSKLPPPSRLGRRQLQLWPQWRATPKHLPRRKRNLVAPRSLPVQWHHHPRRSLLPGHGCAR
jgi:chromosome segregation ATPase